MTADGMDSMQSGTTHGSGGGNQTGAGVPNLRRGFGNRQPILAHAVQVKLDRLVDVFLYLFECVTG